MDVSTAYEQRVQQALKDFGIAPSIMVKRRQVVQLECEDLVSIGLDMFGRELRLERHTAAQWRQMVEAAKVDGVKLLAISAFRSFDYQRGIIERKLAEGFKIEEIMRSSALPGYSEHHTGRAIDIGTSGSPPLEEEFERTKAFEWLTAHAVEFGFSMTYPRNNPFGIIYEPWHWCCRP